MEDAPGEYGSVLEASGGIWEASGGIWEASGTIWKHLKLSGGS